jgi:methionyl-tRNA formyltransferase
MGTPDFAVPALKSLMASRHQVVAVYSQPPRPKGRGQHVQESPVHQCAMAAGIPVKTPLNFKRDEDIATFMGFEADVAIVAAYGLILPPVILQSPRFGCINIHASLLPRWRGAAPIHRAILAGDEMTGVTIMQMEAGLDTGPIITSKSVPIRTTTTAQSLHDILSALGASMIKDVVDDLAQHGKLTLTPQPDEGVTYAKMLKKDEGMIDWNQEAAAIHRCLRALNPWPSTWAMLSGRRFKILEGDVINEHTTQAIGTILNDSGHVACGNGSVLKIESLQPENKKPMRFEDALHGGYLAVGQIWD